MDQLPTVNKEAGILLTHSNVVFTLSVTVDVLPFL